MPVIKALVIMMLTAMMCDHCQYTAKHVVLTVPGLTVMATYIVFAVILKYRRSTVSQRLRQEGGKHW